MTNRIGNAQSTPQINPTQSQSTGPSNAQKLGQLIGQLNSTSAQKIGNSLQNQLGFQGPQLNQTFGQALKNVVETLSEATQALDQNGGAPVE